MFGGSMKADLECQTLSPLPSLGRPKAPQNAPGAVDYETWVSPKFHELQLDLVHNGALEPAVLGFFSNVSSLSNLRVSQTFLPLSKPAVEPFLLV